MDVGAAQCQWALPQNFLTSSHCSKPVPWTCSFLSYGLATAVYRLFYQGPFCTVSHIHWQWWHLSAHMPKSRFAGLATLQQWVFDQPLRPHHENDRCLVSIGAWSWRASPSKALPSVQRKPHIIPRVLFVGFVPAQKIFLHWYFCACLTGGRSSHKVFVPGGPTHRSYSGFSLQCCQQMERNSGRLEWFSQWSFVQGGMGGNNAPLLTLP